MLRRLIESRRRTEQQVLSAQKNTPVNNCLRLVISTKEKLSQRRRFLANRVQTQQRKQVEESQAQSTIQAESSRIRLPYTRSRLASVLLFQKDKEQQLTISRPQNEHQPNEGMPVKQRPKPINLQKKYQSAPRSRSIQLDPLMTSRDPDPSVRLYQASVLMLTDYNNKLHFISFLNMVCQHLPLFQILGRYYSKQLVSRAKLTSTGTDKILIRKNVILADMFFVIAGQLVDEHGSKRTLQGECYGSRLALASAFECIVVEQNIFMAKYSAVLKVSGIQFYKLLACLRASDRQKHSRVKDWLTAQQTKYSARQEQPNQFLDSQP